MSEGYTPERLLGEISRQDETAFRMFYDTTAPKAFGLIQRICRDKPLAESALLETYTAVWRRADTFDPLRSSGLTWLMAIARNRATEVLRRQMASDPMTAQRRSEAESNLPDIEFARPSHGELSALLTHLEALNDNQREAILLAYYDGRSRLELGAHFGVRSNTVETWLKQGLTSLQNSLGETANLPKGRRSLKAAERALGLNPIQTESAADAKLRRQWELSFAPLGLAVQEKQPPDDMYLRIMRSLDRKADQLALRRAKRSASTWRWVALIALILAAVFAYLAFAPMDLG